MTESTVIPVVFSIGKLIEMKGWADFWDNFEELWNTKSGTGESFGEYVDSGIMEDLPEVTLNITVHFKEAEA